MPIWWTSVHFFGCFSFTPFSLPCVHNHQIHTRALHVLHRLNQLTPISMQIIFSFINSWIYRSKTSLSNHTTHVAQIKKNLIRARSHSKFFVPTFFRWMSFSITLKLIISTYSILPIWLYFLLTSMRPYSHSWLHRTKFYTHFSIFNVLFRRWCGLIGSSELPEIYCRCLLCFCNDAWSCCWSCSACGERATF